MAKFKVGDRVKCICNSIYMKVGQEGIVAEEGSGTPWISIAGNTLAPQDYNGYKNCNPICEVDLELVTEQYTKLNPKKGDKFTVIKDLHLKTSDKETREEAKAGTVITFNRFEGDRFSISKSWMYDNECLTTEYLQPIPSPEPITVSDNNVYDIIAQAKEALSARELYYQEPTIYKQWKDMYMGRLQAGDIIRVADLGTEPIKKTNLIQKTMNAFKKAMLSADTKTLIKAGYLYDTSLELTTKGKQALDFILFEANKEALVAAAQATIAEEKEEVL